MAEAHAAVAFQFTVTPEGRLSLNVDRDLLKLVWLQGIHDWQKRFARIRNQVRNGVYPASPVTLLLTILAISAFYFFNLDISFGWINTIAAYTPGISQLEPPICDILSIVLISTFIWVVAALSIRQLLKYLLSFHFWMYDKPGKPSLRTKLLFSVIRLLTLNRPNLMSYQFSLPHQPVPAVRKTLTRYLRSMRPLLDDMSYKKLEEMANEFANTIANRLQRYLVFKSWWASNYISDWWEEYVYMRGRSPIMINSNFYIMDAMVEPKACQAARAANMIHSILRFRNKIFHEHLEPMLIQRIIPVCSSQYERNFNSTRIPGIESDEIKHCFDSRHVAVYHRGRFFKMFVRVGGRYLSPCELEKSLTEILNDTSQPVEGEEHLAALTAGDRIPWAITRKEYFSRGHNKYSLDSIEKAAFFVTLDTESLEIDYTRSETMDKFASHMLFGKCYDKWFDKTFTLVVTANGRVGLNGEHSWADAPILGHMWEYALFDNIQRIRNGADAPVLGHLWEYALLNSYSSGYDDKGHTLGDIQTTPPRPIRLRWELPPPCVERIEHSLVIARRLADDTHMHVFSFWEYGKGLIKKVKVSPDGWLQLVLQIAFKRNMGFFCQTYEASMTRLFRDGRTETVRSCTVESCDFVNAFDDPKKTVGEVRALFRRACENHVKLYRDAMVGRGVDRHIFCLYVITKYLKLDSPFLNYALNVPWRLSTSQTPVGQVKGVIHSGPEYLGAGGGFGPVTDDGYGVSYIVVGDEMISFHISSKRSCPETDSETFGTCIKKAMRDLRDLFMCDKEIGENESVMKTRAATSVTITDKVEDEEARGCGGGGGDVMSNGQHSDGGDSGFNETKN